MRFRLFRSRAFWFGVPGLVFLLCGWWMSMGHSSYAGFGGSPEWSIRQGGGEVFAAWSSFGWPDWRQVYGRHQKVPVEYFGHSKANLAAWCKYWTNSGYVVVSYHWLVLCYVAVWAGLIFWRKRKYEKRLVG